MNQKRALIICESYHHGNTLKVAKVIAKTLNAKIKKSSEVTKGELGKYSLIGFGSGIYDGKHHLAILNLVDKLSKTSGKKTFIFSTSGVPVSVFGDKFLLNYSARAHSTLKNKLESKGYKVLGDFICPGFNTNVFLKYFGGINKNRPNASDFEKAKDFASKLKTL
jgi:flavodoxin